ncbi:MAG TPA: ribosome maturation factor RimM [Acidimicrobiales bacterium]|jgi:16S rRNA processing protein RimM|nr:ribosome maturation factor RimM [Acidimicrobiales bacterium]
MLDVARVAKPHGLRGEVVVELLTNRTERIDAGTVLHSDRGDMAIERSSPHQGRWIVQFEGVHSREDADALRGLVLRAEPIEDPDALWVHDLIGAEVVDTVGTPLGTVAAVEANPASDLLVLEGGGLVPLTFVTETGPGRVVVDPPPGLLD